jgi:predicted permease
MRAILGWLRRLIGRDRLERDLDRELRFHVDEDTRRLVAAGVPQAEARRRALASFGGLEPMKEATRGARGTRWLEHLWQDVRYAGRMMRRSPTFTLAAVLSLAIGIGANAAVFSVTDALVVRSLPVVKPGELYFLNRAGYDEPNLRFSYPNLEHFRSGVPSVLFAAMGSAIRAQAARDGKAELLIGQLVTGDWFDVLGIRPAAGRLLTMADTRTVGGPPIVVLSHAYWTSAFARDPGVVGTTLAINGAPLTIMGVAAKGFDGVTVGQRVSAWLPVTMQMEARFHGDANISNADWRKPWLPQDGVQWLTIVARVAPPVQPAAVLAQIQGIDRQWLQGLVAGIQDPQRRAFMEREHVELVPAARGLSSLRDNFSLALGVLMGTVALVLLIACANLASLLLARSAARGREFALRLSLGAGRGRLVRQLLTESVTLALLGGLAGLALARWGGQALLRMGSSGPNPVPLTLPLDWTFLGFTLTLSVVTGVLFGLVPALRFSRLDPGHGLKTGGRVVNGLGGSGGFPVGKALVVAQMALSLALLVGAMLFLKTFRNLLAVDTGFERSLVVSARFDPRLAGFNEAQLPALYQRLLDRARAIPGVRTASLALSGPVTGSARTSDITVEGRARFADDNSVREDIVSLDYFATLGMPLVAGRTFQPYDDAKAPTVAVVNEAMARRFFDDASPIGRRFGYGTPATFEIVGVVRDAKIDGLREPVPSLVFYPQQQNLQEFVRNLYVRTSGSPERVKAELARAVGEADRNLAVREVVTLADLAERTVVRERLVSQLTAAFGVLAVIVACLGLFGTVSYSVVRRTNEIGVRLALGAAPMSVCWLVLRETLVLVTLGGLIGFAALLPTLKYVSTLLYGLSPHDPAALAAAAGILTFVGVLAGAVPAWRASRVNPLTALRAE